VRAAVIAGRQVHPVPMHSGGFRQPVLHDDPNAFAPRRPQGRAEVAGIVTSRPCSPR
jgi:hypothetical protein